MSRFLPFLLVLTCATGCASGTRSDRSIFRDASTPSDAGVVVPTDAGLARDAGGPDRDAGHDAAAPSCTDGRHNGDETDTDCGGACDRCPDGATCSASADCVSLVCSPASTCAAPACDDGVHNGAETATDCGGGCPGCAEGEACSADSDCASGVCIASACAAPPSVTVEFPSATSTVCSFGTCTPLGTGGGGRYFRTTDYVEQTFTATGLSAITRLDVTFDMDDYTSGCAVGQPLSWNVLVNGAVVGTYGYTGGASMGRFTTMRSYTFAAVSGAGAGDQYTLRFEATTTVCPGGSSWNWFPGGMATLGR